MPGRNAKHTGQYARRQNRRLVLRIAYESGATSRADVARIAGLTRASLRGQDWHILTAGAFVTMVVPLVVFLGLQRFFVRGLLAGSVKG